MIFGCHYTVSECHYVVSECHYTISECHSMVSECHYTISEWPYMISEDLKTSEFLKNSEVFSTDANRCRPSVKFAYPI
jgi:hypothetical protein